MIKLMMFIEGNYGQDCIPLSMLSFDKLMRLVENNISPLKFHYRGAHCIAAER
jgi:D-lyxose ketol-isomerase